VRTAVQNAHDLAVPLHGHPRYRTRGAEFEVLDTHFCRQFAAAGRESFLEFGVEVIENTHASLLQTVALGRLKP
jgi:hypothetical protein